MTALPASESTGENIATTISITDGTTTISLNTDAVPGISTESFRLPRVQREVARISSFPFGSGGRTVASSLTDGEAVWTGHIKDTTVDGVEAQKQALVKLLEAAQRWEELRIGSPVRLAIKRTGATNIAYSVVVGGTIPEQDSDPQDLAVEATNLRLDLRMTLILEPLSHAGALVTYAPDAITMALGGTDFSHTGPAGDMSAPWSIAVARTNAGNPWTEVFIASCPMATTATSMAGSATATGSVLSVTTLTHSSAADGQYNQRVMARVRVDSGTAQALQLRIRYRTGAAGSITTTLPWVSYPFLTGAYYLMDLGTVPPRPVTHDHAVAGTFTTTIYVEARTIDASSVGFTKDATEVVPYLGFVKLTGISVGNGDSVVYDQTAKSGTFFWPRQFPATYVVNGSGALQMAAARHGRLEPLIPGQTTSFWVQGQSGSLHQTSDAASVQISYITRYALGLRGAT